MKKVLKILGTGFLVVILIAIIYGIVINESLPQGETGPKADALAHKMLKALNYEAYQNTRSMEWSFRNGKNHYVWNRELGTCIVKWGDYEVRLWLSNPDKSEATRTGIVLSDKEAEKVIEKALHYFNNDSFWLVAPYKVFDNGTTRSIITTEYGYQGLLVTYSSGGSTPGDSYLWLLNENGFPNAFKMWVGIFPIGSIKATWDVWLVTQSGAFLPKTHELGPLTLSMGNVKAYNK